MVVLDPTLTKILVNKNEDLELLAWDQLFERLALISISFLSLFLALKALENIQGFLESKMKVLESQVFPFW